MEKAARDIRPLPLFRSPAQARLLTHLYVTGAGRPESLTTLARSTEIALSTVQREIEQLERAGLVESERIGNTRLVSANESSPFYEDLASLLMKAFGPTTVLASLMRQIPNIA